MKLLFLYSFLFTVSVELALAQNIFSGEPLQVTGTMNSFTTAAATNSTYRRITTTSGNPTDGRGQWVKTYNSQPTGGDVSNINMSGGSGGGFLFISGPSSNRFQNKWVFSGVGQAKLDTINTISAYNFGQDMGLNMSTPGRYTFVFNDCGYTATNGFFYVGYTQNQPVQLSGAVMQVLPNNVLQLQVCTSAKPSATERVYVRYTSGTNFASGSNSNVLACASINSPADTLWQVSLPAAASGTSIMYYFFTSTLTEAQLNALNETGKSLSALQVIDNNGLNFQHAFVPRYRQIFRLDMRPLACTALDSVTLTGNHPAIGSWVYARKLKANGLLYTDTFMLDSGILLEYKYRYHIKGVTTWESNFSTLSGNREIRILKDSLLPAYCFSEQGQCGVVWPPSAVKLRVDLSEITPDPQLKVYVIGNFTQPQWQSGAVRMQPVSGKPGLFELTTQVCVDTLLYKFMNGDSSLAANSESFPDPNERGCLVNNGLGGFNRILIRNFSGNSEEAEFLFNKCSKKEEVQISNPIPNIVCGNNIVTIQYKLRSAQYTDTTFVIEISDTSGSFAQPINAGTVRLFNQVGQTNITVPAPVIAGKCLVRLVSPSKTIISSTLEIIRRFPASIGEVTGPTFVIINETYEYQTTLPVGLNAIWDVNGGSIQTGAGTNKIAIKWTTAGTFNLKVKANDTCSNQRQLAITVCQPLGVDSIIGKKQVKIADTVSYEAANKNFSVYFWDVSNNGKLVEGGVTAQVKVVWQSGNSGRISVFPAETCADTVSISVAIGTTGLLPLSEYNSIFYPNPVNDKLFFSEENSHSKITIANLTGAICFETDDLSRGYYIETHNLPTGLYFLTIQNHTNTRIFKLIKL
jgi:hypothetical protein